MLDLYDIATIYQPSEGLPELRYRLFPLAEGSRVADKYLKELIAYSSVSRR